MNNYPKCITEVSIPEVFPLLHAFKQGPQDHMECDGFTTTERELLDKCKRGPNNTNFSQWTPLGWTLPDKYNKQIPLPPDTCCDISFNIDTNMPDRTIFADVPLERTPPAPSPAFLRDIKTIKIEPMEEETQNYRIQPTAETYPNLMNTLQRLKNLRPY